MVGLIQTINNWKSNNIIKHVLQYLLQMFVSLELNSKSWVDSKYLEALDKTWTELYICYFMNEKIKNSWRPSSLQNGCWGPEVVTFFMRF